MAVGERKTYHHGDLRAQLIEGAIALIQQGQISQLSLREIARRIGVSHNAPYRHFQDKEALLAAVAEQGFQSLSAALAAALENASSNPSQRLEAIGIAYVHFALQHPAHYRVMFGSCNSDVQQNTALFNASLKAFEVLVQVIQEGQAKNSFRAGDTVKMAQVAWSLVHGQAMLAIDGKLPPDEAFEEFLQFSAQMLIAGMRC
jgi:AcrR family transcriptional regulator